MKNEILTQIANTGIVPVVKINDADDALPLTKALSEGGIDCIEITFRSEHAVKAIKEISKNHPEMLILAGTVTSIDQAQSAVNAGAKLIVTPGFNHDVVKWCQNNNILIIPGVSTASEIEMALNYNINYVKFFPAESSGGARKIKDLWAPYQNLQFMPTGGINAKNLHEYLSLPCVDACGGSFMIDEQAINNKDFEKITALCKETIAKMLDFRLIHIGINSNNQAEALNTANILCNLFNFNLYYKPKSYFAGEGFEIMHNQGFGEKGHIAIYTPYLEKAIYHLAKKGIKIKEETITRNKKTNRINLVYLDLEISGFAIHLINPDVKM